MKPVSHALLWVLTASLSLTAAVRGDGHPPPGFCDLIEIDAPIQVDLRYLGRDNFRGRPVDGYQANRLIVSEAAGRALARVQAELQPMGLGLVDIQCGQTLDMGTPRVFLPESWPAFADLLPQQRASRLLLRALMLRHGFRPLEQEWWHFTLEDEPFPDTYFNFPIRASTATPQRNRLRGRPDYKRGKFDYAQWQTSRTISRSTVNDTASEFDS